GLPQLEIRQRDNEGPVALDMGVAGWLAREARGRSTERPASGPGQAVVLGAAAVDQDPRGIGAAVESVEVRGGLDADLAAAAGAASLVVLDVFVDDVGA